MGRITASEFPLQRELKASYVVVTELLGVDGEFA